MHDTTHFDSEDDYLKVFETSVTVNESPSQDHVHRDRINEETVGPIPRCLSVLPFFENSKNKLLNRKFKLV